MPSPRVPVTDAPKVALDRVEVAHLNWRPFPFQVMRVDGPPDLIVYSDGFYKVIAGREDGLKILARWIAWAAAQRDTVLWVRLRSHALPSWIEFATTERSSLDLVVFPFHLAIKPHEWKEIRQRKRWKTEAINPPSLAPGRNAPSLGYEEFKWRGLDTRIGVSTLFVAGDDKTFLGMADAIDCVAPYPEGHVHLDHVARHRDYDTMILTLLPPD